MSNCADVVEQVRVFLIEISIAGVGGGGGGNRD